jgi:hypothetical protein
MNRAVPGPNSSPGALDPARHALPFDPCVVPRARQIESLPRAKPDICGGGYVRRSGFGEGKMALQIPMLRTATVVLTVTQ